MKVIFKGDLSGVIIKITKRRRTNQFYSKKAISDYYRSKDD